jgi:hypothetical protein
MHVHWWLHCSLLTLTSVQNGILCVINLSSCFLVSNCVFLVVEFWLFPFYVLVFYCGWRLQVTMSSIDKAVTLKNTTNMYPHFCIMLRWHNYNLYHKNCVPYLLDFPCSYLLKSFVDYIYVKTKFIV